MGPAAYEFVDFLARAKQSVWQILPLSPVDSAYFYSPYSSISAFAGNELLVSPRKLAEDGFIETGWIPAERDIGFCDYGEAEKETRSVLDRAYSRFESKRLLRSEYEGFCSINSHWLEDYALFVVAKRLQNGAPWNRWPEPLRDRKPDALKEARSRYSSEIEREKFAQFVFFRQWMSLKRYCNERGVSIFGDMPIYVSYDSADVWRESEIFKLQANKEPLFVSGVPPDYFSETGQLWGNPVYDWNALRAGGYRWWIERFAHNLGLFDMVRVDHFRGFVGYWEIPAGETTAVRGKWVKTPAEDFFSTLRKRFPHARIVAEDLGVITEDVREIMARFGIPGMRVLIFAFDRYDPDHPYLPHNYVRDCVAYTGTHDNNTVRGWFESEATSDAKKCLADYFGAGLKCENVHISLMRFLMMSVADLVVFPMQDVLGLGEEARMNRPAIPRGNWRWRIPPRQIDPSLEETLGKMTEIYGRAPRKRSSDQDSDARFGR